MNVHLDACKIFFKFDCTKLKFKKNIIVVLNLEVGIGGWI